MLAIDGDDTAEGTVLSLLGGVGWSLVSSLWERVQLGVQEGGQRPEGRPPFWDEDRPDVFSLPL